MKRRDKTIIGLIAVLLGILLVRQVYLTKEVESLKRDEENQFLTVEIARLLESNSKLRVEVKELGTTLEKYQKALSDRQSAAEEMSKNLEKYRIISGRTKVEGKGIEILIKGDLSGSQMVDLINALKNIGIEAIGLNGLRLIASSFIQEAQGALYLENKKINPPYQILAIGNPLLLKESLERTGGILEQIKEEKAGSIEIIVNEKEQIVLEKHID